MEASKREKHSFATCHLRQSPGTIAHISSPTTAYSQAGTTINFPSLVPSKTASATHKAVFLDSKRTTAQILKCELSESSPQPDRIDPAAHLLMKRCHVVAIKPVCRGILWERRTDADHVDLTPLVPENQNRLKHTTNDDGSETRRVETDIALWCDISKRRQELDDEE